MDRLSQVVAVGQQITGEGYDLTVTRLLIAPTQTIIEVEGRAAAGFAVVSAGLTADGLAVPVHGSVSSQVMPAAGPGEVSYRFAFDRIGGDPKEVTFAVELPDGQRKVRVELR